MCLSEDLSDETLRHLGEGPRRCIVALLSNNLQRSKVNGSI